MVRRAREAQVTGKGVLRLLLTAYSETQLVSNFRPRAYQFLKRLQEGWRADADRVDLWWPVCLGGGAACYFGISGEPPAIVPLSVVLGLGAVLLWRLYSQTHPVETDVQLRQGWGRYTHRLHAILMIFAPGIFAASLGFFLADWRTDRLAGPIIQKETRAVTIEGRLLSFEDKDKKIRLIIQVKLIQGMHTEELPLKVRVTWRGAQFDALPGDEIRLRAVLNTPPSPVMPGAVDFGRQLYFQQIGGVGYALGPPERLPQQEGRFLDNIRGKVAAVRLGLMRRIIAATAGAPAGGGIAAALVTGRRDGIPAFATDALRDAGLAHLLAISGLHMGLVSGLLFFLSRYLLACSEKLALNYPIKKWAAIVALLGGAGYLILSGGAWSARRAYIMAAVMFCAILVDRRALSMRNVAIAASIMLIMTPEAILSAGFQMSFAAVVVIIAYAEWWQARRWRKNTPAPAGRWQRWRISAMQYFISLSAVSIISGIATGPFAIFHFNHMANYGLIANLLAMPLVSSWVVPMALLGGALLPFGLDGYAWQSMAFGLDIIIGISVWTQNIPGAVFLTPSMPSLAFYMFVISGLVFCLFRSLVRWAALICLPIAFISYGLDTAPHILLARAGKNVAIRLEDGTGYALLSRQRERFAAATWLRSSGYTPELSSMPRIDEMGQCDQNGCVMKTSKGYEVAISKAPKTLAEDCVRADLIITLYPLERSIKAACTAEIIEASFGTFDDTLSLTFTRMGGLRVDKVSTRRNNRPWSAAYRQAP